MKELMMEVFGYIVDADAPKKDPVPPEVKKAADKVVRGYYYQGDTYLGRVYNGEWIEPTAKPAKPKVDKKTSAAKEEPKKDEPQATTQPPTITPPPVESKPTKVPVPKSPEEWRASGKKLLDNIESSFEYLPPHLTIFRERSFQRFSRLLGSKRLSDESKEKVLYLGTGLRRLLRDWTTATTNPDFETRRRARTRAIKLAEMLIKKYGFYTNGNKTALKTLAITDDPFRSMHYRHIVGDNSALAGDLVSILEDLTYKTLPTKNATEVQFLQDVKNATHVKLAGDVAVAQLPRLSTLLSNSPLFKNFNLSKTRFYVPLDEAGNPVDNKGGQNSEIFFNHSLNNPIVSNIRQTFKENLEPRSLRMFEEYEARLKDISKNYSTLTPQERSQKVAEAYSTLFAGLFDTDQQLCGAALQNMSELFLYQREITANKEAYLPSTRSFGSIDKVVVESDKNSFAERIAGISIKSKVTPLSAEVEDFLKEVTFGHPAQSSALSRYHPDEFYSGFLDGGSSSGRYSGPITNGRPGAVGYSLGIRNSILENNEEWLRMAKDSGYMSDAGTPRWKRIGEEFKSIQAEISSAIEAERVKRVSQGQRGITSEDVTKIFKQFSTNQATLAKARRAVFGPDNANETKLRAIMGDQRVELLKKYPLSFPAVVATDALIRTANGFPDIKHSNQEVFMDQYTGETRFKESIRAGTSDPTAWELSWRAVDKRAGGLLISFKGKK